MRALSVEPPPGADPISGSSGEFPHVLGFEAAVRSTDLRVRTMAKILELLCALVRIDVALFYTVDERLEKYAVEPIVAKVTPARSVDLDAVLRQHRERRAGHDPFGLSHAAGSQVTILTSQDVGGEGVSRRSRHAANLVAKFSLVQVGEVYLRAGGRIAAAITLLRDRSAPELAVSEIYMLRRLHGLCEHAYRLAGRTSGAGGDVLHTSGLTPRQREVLLLAVRGATSRDIAATLQISHATVKTHLRHAFKKLGVANRHQALLLLMQALPPAAHSPYPPGSESP